MKRGGVAVRSIDRRVDAVDAQAREVIADRCVLDHEAERADRRRERLRRVLPVTEHEGNGLAGAQRRMESRR